jgi:CHAT domain-containing protein
LIRYRPFNSQTLERGQPHYAAYLLAATGEPQWVNLGEAAAIDSKVRTFKRRIQTIESDVESRFFPDAQALYAVLMAPVIAKLPPNTQHLLISPDSQLNLISFGAIVNLDGRYLIEDYQITYLTSGRDLLRYAHTTPSQTPALILADINYDAPGEIAIAQLPRENRRSRELRGEFLALEHTAIEGEKIAQLLTDATLLTQDGATEGAIKAAQGPEILHIATHGFFLQLEQVAAADLTSQFLLRDDTLQRPQVPSQENPLLRSGLALAGFNPRQSGPEDGVLTALEVAGLNLYGTKLTVLSACETGLGEVTNGDGVYGLRRALVIAGSESQLMSLWQVDDAATQQLMVDYYQALRSGAGRSAALRQVQLDMIATANYAAPFYWAAFIPSGNWQPLRNAQSFPK